MIPFFALGYPPTSLLVDGHMGHFVGFLEGVLGPNQFGQLEPIHLVIDVVVEWCNS